MTYAESEIVFRHENPSADELCAVGSAQHGWSGNMKIKYKLLNSGAFVAGDVDTGITSYAYQSSVYATEARRRAQDIAEKMVSGESPYMHVSDYARGYDASNWELLGGRE